MIVKKFSMAEFFLLLSIISCFLATSPMILGSLLLPIALVLAHNLVTFALTMYHLRRAKKDEDGASSEPLALRLTVTAGIWILLTVSLCSGFLSIHTSSWEASVIFASANCFLVSFNSSI